MAFILSLETSTAVCSVAVHEEERLLATLEIHREQSHASKLAVLVDEVFALAGVKVDQVNAVVISSGPGSYTGLRIGTSTAKGICYSVGIPLIAVGTLDLLAAQVKRINTMRAYLCPMIDARRMEVYCQLIDADGRTVEPVQAKVIEANSFEEYLNNAPIIFFGNGAAKCRPMIQHSNAVFVDDVYPSAETLGKIGFGKYQRNQVEDLIHFEPYYLKEFMIKKPRGKESVSPEQV